MSKKYIQKLKKSSLFSEKSATNLKTKLEKEATKNEKELKKEFKNMTVEEVENLFIKYIF